MDDWDMTDALIRALARMRALSTETPPRRRAGPLPPYVVTLAGVSYDSSQHRLRAQISVKRPARRCYTLGSGRTTREDEERLHALWLRAKALMNDGLTAEEAAARVKERQP